eukprot:gene11684-21578_t
MPEVFVAPAPDAPRATPARRDANGPRDRRRRRRDEFGADGERDRRRRRRDAAKPPPPATAGGELLCPCCRGAALQAMPASLVDAHGSGAGAGDRW